MRNLMLCKIMALKLKRCCMLLRMLLLALILASSSSNCFAFAVCISVSFAWSGVQPSSVHRCS
jgi:hypothetical protein